VGRAQLHHRGEFFLDQIGAWHAGEMLMAEPESEPTAAVGAVIEAEISMQRVPPLPPQMGPIQGLGVPGSFAEQQPRRDP
jgi:hypothetical protein